MADKEKVYVTLSQSSRIRKTLKQMWFAVWHDKVGFVGFCILILIVGMSLLAPAVCPPDRVSDP